MAEGLRRITVERRQFRWRFDDVLVVIPADHSGPQLYVDWGWREFCDPPEGPWPEPTVVTPRFVADAVRFALAHGWEPEVNGPPLRLAYEGGSFRVARDRV